MFENLNLRPANKSKMIEFISKNKPEVLEDFKKVDKRYWNKVEEEIRKLCKNPRIYFYHGIPKYYYPPSVTKDLNIRESCYFT